MHAFSITDATRVGLRVHCETRTVFWSDAIDGLPRVGTLISMAGIWWYPGSYDADRSIFRHLGCVRKAS